MILNNIADVTTLATELVSSLKKQDIILLKGNLGVGKTTLVREIIRSLAGDSTLLVSSPTFPILQIYDLPNIKIYHFDLYRLKSREEVLELGIEEAFENGICLIEWPEIIEDIFSEIPHKVINISIFAKGGRKYIIK